MKKTIIKIIIILLLIYIGISIFEMIDCDKKVEPIQQEVVEEKKNSEYIDYAKVEVVQRRRGLMIID